MTPEAFRALAVAFPGAEEKAHHGNPDYRVNDRIFATSGASTGRPVVKLSPEIQEMLLSAEPDVLTAASGAWGRQGWTHIDLSRADEALAQDLLARAYALVSAKSARRARGR